MENRPVTIVASSSEKSGIKMEKENNKKAVLFPEQLSQTQSKRLLLVSEHLLAFSSFSPSVGPHRSMDDRLVTRTKFLNQ